MLLFPSKQTASLNYHYKTVKVQKSSLYLSCIRVSLPFFLFIYLQLWSWDFSCFTSDSDIFWKASGKVLSSVSMLSNHTLQNKNEAEALAPSGWEGLFPSCLMAPVGYSEAQGARRFSSAELLISVTSPLFSCMTVLKPRNSHFSLFPQPPLENKIIHTVTRN